MYVNYTAHVTSSVNELSSREALRFPPQQDHSLWSLTAWLPAERCCSRLLLSSFDAGAAWSLADWSGSLLLRLAGRCSQEVKVSVLLCTGIAKDLTYRREHTHKNSQEDCIGGTDELTLVLVQEHLEEQLWTTGTCLSPL